MPWIAQTKRPLPLSWCSCSASPFTSGEQIDKVLEALEDPVINGLRRRSMAWLLVA